MVEVVISLEFLMNGNIRQPPSDGGVVVFEVENYGGSNYYRGQSGGGNRRPTAQMI